MRLSFISSLAIYATIHTAAAYTHVTFHRSIQVKDNRGRVCAQPGDEANSIFGEDGPKDKLSRGGQPTVGGHFRGVRTTLSEVDGRGRLVRSPSRYRSWVGPNSRFLPQPDRYHLYASLADPWSCRVLSVLYMKGLDSVIGVSIVHPTWQRTRPDDELDSHVGWVFRHPDEPPVRGLAGGGPWAIDHDCNGCVPDYVNGLSTIRDIYELVRDKDGKYSVPLLWDKHHGVIVNNESGDLVRMLSSAFNDLSAHPSLDLCPPALSPVINRLNDWVYWGVNEGVYACAFARSQQAYEEGDRAVFNALDRAEALLSTQRYLAGTRFTEADVRLFQTLVRFDEVYSVLGRCSRRRIFPDYPNLLNYAREVYQLPISYSVNMGHIKKHYYSSYPSLYPTGIIPEGPHFISQLFQPHDRERLPGEGIFFS